MIKINKATDIIEFKTIEKLANIILHEVYDSFIPSKYTDDFLKEFQSVKAIQYQISNEKFSYYLLTFNTKSIGYIGVKEANEKLILSKLYLLVSFRGLKIGKLAFEFVIELAKDNGFTKIELIVKKQNNDAIAIYLKNGFKIIESITNTFPSGYFVEDYKMEMVL